MGKPQPGQRLGRRVTLTQAAEILGLSRDAVRMRVRRGSLESEKGEDGRVYVFLEPDQARAQDARPQAEDETSATWATLVDELRDQVHYLRDQHRREQDAHAEARRIIAALAQRIPEIEAPSTASHSPQERPEKPSPTETPSRCSRGRRAPAATEQMVRSGNSQPALVGVCAGNNHRVR